jgi:shikimate kinase
MITNNLFLIGPMGSGKTTVGRQLAKALKFQFVDSDQEIQKRTGVDIPTIFEYEGESGFRQRECQVIADLVTRKNIVLATGGGAILNPVNRQCLADHGLVIYLHCSPEQQHVRTARDHNRPLLAQASNPIQRLRDLMHEREPLYRQLAQLTVTTERRQTRAIVKEICLYLQQQS